MIYCRNLQSISTQLNSTVVTIGNFDGIHAGHQRLLDELLNQATQRKASSLVLSFDPYPKEFFLGKRVPRLMSWREKFLFLQEQGIDYFVTVHFDKKFAQLTAEAFITEILVKKLQAKKIIVGDDFHFGAGRKGNYQLLRDLASRCDFEVMQLPMYEYLGERVSSSRIRHTLQAGNMALAKELLGHPYFLRGTVIHGNKLGRRLGFPTANIDLHRRLVPLSGVYVVRVTDIDAGVYGGVANVGTRPAVQGTCSLLEVFIFDFNREIYGQTIKVEFLHKLRDEENFENLELLKEKIQQDVEAAIHVYGISKL